MAETELGILIPGGKFELMLFLCKERDFYKTLGQPKLMKENSMESYFEI